MLLYKAERYPSDKASRILGLRLFYVLIDVCARFLIDAAFNKDVVKVTDKHIQNLWRRMLATSHTTLEVFGREVLSPGASYVYMSNHQSFVDIAALFAAIPGSLRMVGKEELRKVPIFGQALERAGFVLVDRKKRVKAIAQLEQAKARLREGLSLWIAPEGTRARDPNLDLLPFKKGGFHTAIALEIPIVPIWIEGAADIIFADSIKVYPNKTMTIYFGEPIPTKGLAASQIPEVMQKVRAAMLELQKIARNEANQVKSGNTRLG